MPYFAPALFSVLCASIVTLFIALVCGVSSEDCIGVLVGLAYAGLGWDGWVGHIISMR